MVKAIQYKIPKESPPPDPFRLTRIDGGLNVKEEQSSIRDNQSPYMLNCSADDRGALQKRPGQELLFATSLGTGDTHLFIDYRKKSGTVKTLLHHGTKLYTQSGTDQPIEIAASLSDQKGAAFVFGDIFYYVLPSGILTYDGTTVATLVPYVPTVTLGRPAAGGGTTNEQYNLLSNSFKDSFSADGTARFYFASQKDLSVTPLTVNYNGTDYAEITGFTVDRKNGKVDTLPIDIVLGDSTTRIDITKTATNTYKYTFNGTGINPNFETQLAVNDWVYINAEKFSVVNNGLFKVIEVGTSYFKITNVSGFAENDKVVGTGMIGKRLQLGDSTTRIDISNTSGDTYRYTFDGTGTNPSFETKLAVGNWVYINGQNFNANNNGSFQITAVGTSYFEITNANGVAEVDKVLGTGSINKLTTTGKPVGIPLAGTNNVVIQAEKTGLMDATRINKCIYSAQYGGANDTRVFLTGNPDYPSSVWWCYVQQPTYWRENDFNFVGSDADKNTGLLVHYQDLLLFKERSIYRIEYIQTSGVASFPSYPINSSVGCDIPYSIQLIDNLPTFCNTYAGPHVIVATNVREEKNVRPIGGNINGAPTRTGLLDESKDNLLLATSVDFDGKYWLNVGTKVYVWDYQLSSYNGNEESLAWFLYDNINANCWLIRDRELYYGKRGAGQVVRFIPQLADFGTAINGVWKSKLFHFGYPEWLKTISEVYFRSRETANTSLTIDYFSDTGETLDSITLTSASFSLVNFTLALFSLAVYHFPPVFRLRPKMKKVVYFQFQISNNTVGQDLSIMDLVINFNNTKRVK